jgi:hypothetical protein
MALEKSDRQHATAHLGHFQRSNIGRETLLTTNLPMPKDSLNRRKDTENHPIQPINKYQCAVFDDLQESQSKSMI